MIVKVVRVKIANHRTGRKGREGGGIGIGRGGGGGCGGDGGGGNAQKGDRTE